jgi:flagellar basal-body rod protein FlgG
MDVLFTAYPALGVQMNVVDNIANNLANAQTNGFKRQFERVLQNEASVLMEARADLRPGDVVATGNELDVAIDGPGFFAIETPEGVRYTRAGSFELNSDGDLVTKDGLKVLSSSGGAINLSGKSLQIQDNGAVLVDGAEVATLKLVTFSDDTRLIQEGASRFRWDGPSEGAVDSADPRMRSGYLERSNVNATAEMVRLIAAYREFEAIQRTVTTVHGGMTARLIQDMGRLG